MKHMVITIFLWLAAIGFAVLIYVLQSQPGEETAETSFWLTEYIARLIFQAPTEHQLQTLDYLVRQAARLALYGAFGLAGCGAVLSSALAGGKTGKQRKRNRQGKRNKQGLSAVLLTAGVCCVLAFLDEWRKQFIPGRHFDVQDALISMAGVVISMVIVLIVAYHSFWKQKDTIELPQEN
jgi:VanZ family protein